MGRSGTSIKLRMRNRGEELLLYRLPLFVEHFPKSFFNWASASSIGIQGRWRFTMNLGEALYLGALFFRAVAANELLTGHGCGYRNYFEN